MVPIYAIESWLALHFQATVAEPFQILRECYESFVLLSFIQLCYTYLGGPVQFTKKLLAEAKKEDGRKEAKHPPPMCCESSLVALCAAAVLPCRASARGPLTLPAPEPQA